MLISPTEPTQLRSIGQTSSVPENYGVDALWFGPSGMMGVQRKEFRDLVNSVRDGRLGKELSQMKQLSISALIIEGNPSWTTAGNSLTVQSWSRVQHLGLMFSVLSSGCLVMTSGNLAETIELVLQLKKWSEKEHHSGLLNRPNPISKWGRADNRDWGIHLLQSFPGIGLVQAGRIYDKFKGVPLAWTVDEFDLMEVEGIGAVRAKSMMEVLDKDIDITTGRLSDQFGQLEVLNETGQP